MADLVHCSNIPTRRPNNNKLSLFMRWQMHGTDRTKNERYNSKFTIVEVNVNLQSSVQVWFDANVVLVIKC